MQILRYFISWKISIFTIIKKINQSCFMLKIKFFKNTLIFSSCYIKSFYSPQEKWVSGQRVSQNTYDYNKKISNAPYLLGCIKNIINVSTERVRLRDDLDWYLA